MLGAICLVSTGVPKFLGLKLGFETSRATWRSSSFMPPCSAIFLPPVKITRCCDLELPCAKVFMAPRCPSHLAISRLPDLGRGAGASWASSGGKLPEPLGLRTRTCKWPAVKPWIAARFSLTLGVARRDRAISSSNRKFLHSRLQIDAESSR